MTVKPIAVITVTYSPGEYLGTFVDSLARATTRGTYTVLADNGSTDGIPEKTAAADPAVEFLPTGGNVGYGTAINIAVKRLVDKREKGEVNDEYFIISNPDVEFGEGAIDTLIECADRWPDAACVGPLILEADGSAYPSARAVPTITNGVGHALFSAVWPGNPWTAAYRHASDMSVERSAGWLSGSCLLVRWDAFAAIGGFDERYFMYMEDVDLGDRFTRAGYTNVLCPQSTISHAVGHAAGKHPEKMLPAHHDSAYRFQADRHPGLVAAPLRATLWLGLKARAAVAVTCSRLKRK